MNLQSLLHWNELGVNCGSFPQPIIQIEGWPEISCNPTPLARLSSRTPP